MRPGALGVGFVVATAIAGSARAQGVPLAQGDSAGRTTPAPSCVQSIPRESMTRVPVFASLTMRDSSHLSVPPTALIMLQAVADHIATMTGAKPPALPPGEPAITWDSIGQSVLLTWRREGRLAWRVLTDSGSAEPISTKAALLFGRALDSAQAKGETPMPWPDDLSRDSVEMVIEFVRPTIDSVGVVTPVKARVAVPLFSVAAPREKEVRVVRRGMTRYPQRLQVGGVEGRVIMEFAVDTTGRADPQTIHDLWPAELPRLKGAKASYYNELVATARRMIMETRFAPHEAGGCKMRQVVQQPVNWALAR